MVAAGDGAKIAIQKIAIFTNNYNGDSIIIYTLEQMSIESIRRQMELHKMRAMKSNLFYIV